MASQHTHTDQIFAAIREYRAAGTTKSATETPDAKDPADKGTVSVPEADGSDKSKQNMPADNENRDGKAKVPMETELAGAAGLGEGEVPSPDSGKAKEDAFTSPTAKIAAIRSVYDELFGGNPASATTAPAVTEIEPKKAGENQVIVDVDQFRQLVNLAKVAQVLYGTEKGIGIINQAVRESAGIEAAKELLAKSAAAHEYWLAQGRQEAEQQNEMAKAAAEQEAYAERFHAYLMSLPDKDREDIVKIARAHVLFENRIAAQITKEAGEKKWDEGFANHVLELEKAAFGMGAAEAPAMAEQAAAGEEPMIPNGEEGAPLDVNAIKEILTMMVQSGELDQATADALIAQLDAEGGGMEGAEGAEGMEGLEGGGELPPEVKEASALIAKLVTK
jgi:hypothetical protein